MTHVVKRQIIQRARLINETYSGHEAEEAARTFIAHLNKRFKLRCGLWFIGSLAMCSYLTYAANSSSGPAAGIVEIASTVAFIFVLLFGLMFAGVASEGRIAQRNADWMLRNPASFYNACQGAFAIPWGFSNRSDCGT